MSLTNVDWSTIPAPADDGKAAHLQGAPLPEVTLSATTGGSVTLCDLRGTTVIYIYPMTGRPDRDLPAGWNDIPGVRGCIPQSCAFRDRHAELTTLGADHIFGLSAQNTAYQLEAATRLHLPFPLLSDSAGVARDAMRLPTLIAEGERLLKRLTLIARDGVIVQTFYPVFPPDQDATNVADWLQRNAI